MKVIIVGGVAGGASCAARLRRLDETMEVLMVERGPYVSHAIAPVTKPAVIEIAASTLLPIAALLLTVMPLEELLKTLGSMLS